MSKKNNTAQQYVMAVHPPAPVVAVPAVTPLGMINAAVQRGASIEQLTQLIELKERMEADEARKAFVVAMTAFKQNPPTILKNKLADFKTDKGRTTYQYSDLANVCEAITAALAVHGISHDWTTSQTGPAITVTCTLTHALGHSKATTLSAHADQTGGKNAIQAIGSAVSYLERYTLLAACGIAVGDGSDDDGARAGLDRNAVRDAVQDSRRRSNSPADVAASKRGTAEPVDTQLLINARAAADKGRDAFGPFWKELSGKDRNKLASQLPDLEARTRTADVNAKLDAASEGSE